MRTLSREVTLTLILLNASAHAAITSQHDAAALLRVAIDHLTPQDRAMFEDVVGLPLDPLLADTLALPKAELDEIVFDQGKLLCWHRLNARGLRVLRAMLARRASEFNRISKGWESHPQYSFFMHHGFVKKRLDNWKPGDTKDFPLSAAEMDLYRMVTGHDTPWSPVAHDLGQLYGTRARHKVETSNETVWVQHVPLKQRHIYNRRDIQYEAHTDNIAPVFKSFFFFEDVAPGNGPLWYAPSTHRITRNKLQWLWDRTRVRSDMLAWSPCALRHINATLRAETAKHRLVVSTAERLAMRAGLQWCVATDKCVNASFHAQRADLEAHYGFHQLVPMTLQAGSMLIVDTSAFHCRGYERAGVRRAAYGTAVQKLGGRERSTDVATRPMGMCAMGDRAWC